MRIVSLARTVGGIKCDAEIGFDHRCDPAGEAKKPPVYATACRWAAATGLDRPHGGAVNVFFALTLRPTYQCHARMPLRCGREKTATTRMGKPSQSKPPSLAELRREIDRIDEAMHRLLMERGDIIDRLIAAKQTQEKGSA